MKAKRQNLEAVQMDSLLFFAHARRGRRVCRPVGGSVAAIVGADRIRPQHKAPLRGACVPGRLLVDPYRGVVPSILVLPEIRGYGRILSAPTRAHPLKLHFYRNAVPLLLRIIAEQGLNAFVKFMRFALVGVDYQSTRRRLCRRSCRGG